MKRREWMARAAGCAAGLAIVSALPADAEACGLFKKLFHRRSSCGTSQRQCGEPCAPAVAPAPQPSPAPLSPSPSDPPAPAR